MYSNYYVYILANIRTGVREKIQLVKFKTTFGTNLCTKINAPLEYISVILDDLDKFSTY